MFSFHICFSLSPSLTIYSLFSLSLSLSQRDAPGVQAALTQGDRRADLVLHDGAPNASGSWVQDAFEQGSLTLKALGLAVETLRPRGTFVTKVFRSGEYNKLLWVFQQLFEKVEAYKPPASRNTSAEIFVVCRDFKAPKRVDPRITDPKFVFAEVDDKSDMALLAAIAPEYEGDAAAEAALAVDGEIHTAAEPTDMALDKLLQALGAGKKKIRQRQGYAEDDPTLRRTVAVTNFVRSPTPILMLSRVNMLTFGTEGISASGAPDPHSRDQLLYDHPLTTAEIRASCADIKLLGRPAIKQLLRWRVKMRESLAVVEGTKKPEAAEVEAREKTRDELLAEELAAMEARLKKDSNRVKRREYKDRKRWAERVRMNIVNPGDEFDDLRDPDLFDLGKIRSKKDVAAARSTAVPDMKDLVAQSDSDSDSEEEELRPLRAEDDEEDIEEMEDYLDAYCTLRSTVNSHLRRADARVFFFCGPSVSRICSSPMQCASPYASRRQPSPTILTPRSLATHSTTRAWTCSWRGGTGTRRRWRRTRLSCSAATGTRPLK